MINKHRKTAIGFSVAAIFMLAACADGGPQPGSGEGGGEIVTDDFGFAVNTGSAQKGGQIDVLNSSPFSHLDPSMGNDGNVRNFYQLIYRNLVTYSTDPANMNELVPDLATDLGESNEDGTEWTYTLKDDLFYETGDPITAEDIKFAVERSFDPEVGIGAPYHRPFLDESGEYAGIYRDSDGLDSIEVVDEKTIKFHLASPMAGWDHIVATGPFTPFPADEVTNAGYLDETPIASGPYKIAENVSGSHITLERNPEWDPDTDDIRPAYPDKFKFYFGLDQSTIDQRLIADQGSDRNAIASRDNLLLPASVSRVQTPEYKNRIVRGVPACTKHIIMNTSKSPLDDQSVREAIYYAINQNDFLTAVGGEQLGDQTHQMMTPSFPMWEEFNPFPTDNNEGDAEKARQILKDAGYDDDISLVMDVRGLPDWRAQAESVQQSLGAIGIDVTLNEISASAYFETVMTPAKANDLQVHQWCPPWPSGFTMEILFDGNQILDKGNVNGSMLDDPAVNDRFAEIAAMADLEEQDEAYKELQYEILEMATVVPLVYNAGLQMVGSNVGNAYAHPQRVGTINFSTVGLKDPEL